MNIHAYTQSPPTYRFMHILTLMFPLHTYVQILSSTCSYLPTMTHRSMSKVWLNKPHFLPSMPSCPPLWLISDPQGYSNFSVIVTGSHMLEDSQVSGQSLIPLSLTVGHYCPAGTDSAHPCPEGTLNPQESAVSPRACQLCPAGSYCPGEGNISPEGRY